MNDTQKEMQAIREEQKSRQVLLAQAMVEGEAEKKRIDAEAAAKKAAVDLRIRGIATGEIVPEPEKPVAPAKVKK